MHCKLRKPLLAGTMPIAADGAGTLAFPKTSLTSLRVEALPSAKQPMKSKLKGSLGCYGHCGLIVSSSTKVATAQCLCRIPFSSINGCRDSLQPFHAQSSGDDPRLSEKKTHSFHLFSPLFTPLFTSVFPSFSFPCQWFFAFLHLELEVKFPAVRNFLCFFGFFGTFQSSFGFPLVFPFKCQRRPMAFPFAIAVQPKHLGSSLVQGSRA